MIGSLKWLCCCCRCCHFSSSSSSLSGTESWMDDGFSHAHYSNHTFKNPEIQPFYVPRRHSSYNTGTFNAVLVQPQYNNARSLSNTHEYDEIVAADRKHYWESVAITNATEMTSFMHGLRPEDITPPWSPAISSMSSMSSSDERCTAVFDRHILSGIMEVGSAQPQDDEASTSFQCEFENYGSLFFTTSYDSRLEKLKIYIKRAVDLPIKGPLPYYDTFVRAQVISMPKCCCDCRPVRKSLNPIYNEECAINLSRSKWRAAQSHSLRMSVLDLNRSGKYDAIGHAIIPVNKIKSEGIQTFGLPLTPMSLPITNIGQVLVGLFYSAKRSTLFVNVIKARNLRLDEAASQFLFPSFNRENYDTFVKVYLLCGGKKVKTSRSHVVGNSKDPMYNHKSQFVLPPKFTIDASVDVIINVRGILGHSVMLGRVSVGPYTATANRAFTHWGKMMYDQHQTVIRWKTLSL